MRIWFTLSVLLAMAFALNGSAQPKGAAIEATVQFRDRAAKPERVTSLAGQVEESIAGIKIKPNVGDARSVLAGDIVDVVYTVTGLYKLDYDSATKKEQARGAADAMRKSLADAARDYATLVAKMKADDPRIAPVRRHLEYKIATIRANLAETPEQRDEAVSLLTRFGETHKNSWQFQAAALRLGNMLMDKDDFDGAVKVYDQLAKNEGVPKETKQTSGMLAIDALMRANRPADAEKRVADALRTLPPSDPQYGRMQIYQIGCQAGRNEVEKTVAQLEAIIAKASDSGHKALAYNTLGDVYRAKDRKKDAMWQYLWVDVVYNQDRVEHLKALDRLAKLFGELNDTVHMEKYRLKLTSYR